MFRKTLLMLAAALGFSQTNEGWAIDPVVTDTAPPIMASKKILEKLKERTTPILREDLIVHSRHEHDVR